MNKILLFVAIAAFALQSDAVTRDCKCNSIPLYGKVKVVEHNADFKVQIVNSFQDLNVQDVKSFPNECGKWQFVESFPDFTVQYVTAFPDFKIKFVKAFPGKPNSLP